MTVQKTINIEIIGNPKTKPLLSFIVGIHGDEKAPIMAAEKIKQLTKNKINKKKSFRIIYANPKAIKTKKRYIDKDLNNSFFETNNGNYESKLAAFLKKEIQNTQYNFDFHSTNFKLETPYGLISSYSQDLEKVMKGIAINNYIFSDKECLIKYAPNGIGIETGNDNDKNTVNGCCKLMLNILKYFKIIKNGPNSNSNQLNIFLVYKLINRKSIIRLNRNLQDFKKINKNDVIGFDNNSNPILAQENFYAVWLHEGSYLRIAKKIRIQK